MSTLIWNRLLVRTGRRALLALAAFAALGMLASAGVPQGRAAGAPQGRGGGRGNAQTSLDDVLVGTIDVQQAERAESSTAYWYPRGVHPSSREGVRAGGLLGS